MLGEFLDPPVAFGKALRRFRKAAGFSQEQLALEASIQRTYVSLIELGQNQPTITVIFKLAKALGCRPSDLVRAAELDDER
jgi:transcriptional regulator with XRE-family HTH domain